MKLVVLTIFFVLFAPFFSHAEVVQKETDGFEYHDSDNHLA